jgi:hypothetical protein
MIDFITISLILGWFFAIINAISLISAAYFIGSRYALTTTGVSRLGPKIGAKVKPSTFVRKDVISLLNKFAGKGDFILIVFLNTVGDPTLKLIPDLELFLSIRSIYVSTIIIASGPQERMNGLGKPPSSNIEIVHLKNDVDPPTKTLGIRVKPYALLFDKDFRLISKGLVNNYQQLCLLFANAREFLSQTEIEILSQGCDESIRWS